MYLALKKILQMYGLHLVFFLCETKLMSMQMNEISRKLNYENCFIVSSNKNMRWLSYALEFRNHCADQIFQ